MNDLFYVNTTNDDSIVPNRPPFECWLYHPVDLEQIIGPSESQFCHLKIRIVLELS